TLVFPLNDSNRMNPHETQRISGLPPERTAPIVPVGPWSRETGTIGIVRSFRPVARWWQCPDAPHGTTSSRSQGSPRSLMGICGLGFYWNLDVEIWSFLPCPFCQIE